MLEIKVETVAAQLVRHFLVGQGREKEALHIQFDLGLGSYTDNKSFNARVGLHLLYHLQPERSYISVFSAVTNNPFSKVKEVESWRHETTHDSGWRDIGVFSDAYFGLAQLVNLQREAAGLERIAPAKMANHSSFGVFVDKVFYWVPVEVFIDPECDRSYRKLIKIL